jgi:hypothetical protein
LASVVSDQEKRCLALLAKTPAGKGFSGNAVSRIIRVIGR